MKSLFLALIFGLIIPKTLPAQENAVSTNMESGTPEISVRYIAQNTEEEKKKDSDDEEATSKMPPLPAPKTSITTEKPIKGELRGIGIIRGKSSDASPVSGDTDTDALPVKAEQPASVKSPQKPESAKPASRRKPLTAREKSPLVKEELSIFNVSTDNLHTMKLLIDDDFNLRGLVYGEERGFIRLYEFDNDGNFNEVWKSPPLNAPVRELFVEDIDRDGETEIVAYTTQGNIFIYGYQTHDLEYRTPENTYTGISCMAIANLDDDPQLELFFIASAPGSPGKLVQFDPKTQFEEWTSTREFAASDMIIGNVDGDPDVEIILNSGEILSSKFKNIKWESEIEFGDRLYLLDIDGDGMLELITEYDQSYIRIIEVDERREKW